MVVEWSKLYDIVEHVDYRNQKLYHLDTVLAVIDLTEYTEFNPDKKAISVGDLFNVIVKLTNGLCDHWVTRLGYDFSKELLDFKATGAIHNFTQLILAHLYKGDLITVEDKDGHQSKIGLTALLRGITSEYITDYTSLYRIPSEDCTVQMATFNRVVYTV